MATKSAKKRGDHRVPDLSSFGKNAVPNKKYEEIRQAPMPVEDHQPPRRVRDAIERSRFEFHDYDLEDMDWWR